MLIDWFTVGAQALNFVVLVWLLKRFLYQPVLDAIDAREARIAGQIGDAEAKQRDAKAQGDAFRQKSDAFDRQRAAVLTQAAQAAQVERERLVAAGRQAADELGARRREGLKADAMQLDRDLRERVRSEVFAISRKALADLASASLDERIADVFVVRLRALAGPARELLASALQPPAPLATVRSASALPALQQDAIRSAVTDTFGAGVELHFETAPDLVGGIELVAGGQKLAWSIGDYLDSLEHLVSDVVDPQPDAPPAAAAVDAAPPNARAA
ncbi:MAG: F0F1 ATP synthase subunit delta [Caldimonas sp.]